MMYRVYLIIRKIDLIKSWCEKILQVVVIWEKMKTWDDEKYF